MTIKGKIVGISRPEFEYEIPVNDARELMKLSVWPVIDKIRHIIYKFGKKWEVDVFSGANDGLIIAEVELTHADEMVQLPAWVAKEVSGDPRFHNSCIAQNPYCNWKSEVCVITSYSIHYTKLYERLISSCVSALRTIALFFARKAQ